MAGGGAEKLAERKKKGLLTARERIEALFAAIGPRAEQQEMPVQLRGEVSQIVGNWLLMGFGMLLELLGWLSGGR